MKSRAFIMLGLAVFLAGASVYLARNWIENRAQPTAAAENTPQVTTTKVVVATTQLHFGNNIRREHLRVVDWPSSAVPEGSFASIDEILGDPKENNGKKGEPRVERVALRTVEKNEPVLKSKVSGFGGRASLSALIAPGMRATTIRVNDVNGVAGFVLPGDRVDILLTRDPSGGKRSTKNLITDILLQNMKVLGIAQDANESRDKPMVVRAVTLEATQVQAQKLVLAQKVGTLSLALRHVTNVDAEKPQTVTLRDLRVSEANQSPKPKGDKEAGKKPAKDKSVVVSKVSKKKKAGTSVRIVRGLKSSEYEVQPEKPSFSAPAYSKPLNLLPSKLAPANNQVLPAADKLAPSAPAPSTIAPAETNISPTLSSPTLSPPLETAVEDQTKPPILPSAEPISLLKEAGEPGEEG